jgi:hypothetical protein
VVARRAQHPRDEDPGNGADGNASNQADDKLAGGLGGVGWLRAQERDGDHEHEGGCAVVEEALGVHEGYKTWRGGHPAHGADDCDGVRRRDDRSDKESLAHGQSGRDVEDDRHDDRGNEHAGHRKERDTTERPA